MIETVEKQQKEAKKEKQAIEDKRIGCPICGDKDNLRPAGRCVTCLSCGWSRCSL